MVSMYCFMCDMVAIMSGMRATICGISLSSLSMSGIRFSMSSLMVSMPSRVSKIDRIDQHTGMSKQCGSQYRKLRSGRKKSSNSEM